MKMEYSPKRHRNWNIVPIGIWLLMNQLCLVTAHITSGIVCNSLYRNSDLDPQTRVNTSKKNTTSWDDTSLLFHDCVII